MTCNHCQGADALFNQRTARREHQQYLKKGPRKTTALLVDALKKHDVTGLSLLDIGGGVGAIQHELIQEGLDQVHGIDASTAYLEAATAIHEARGTETQAQLQYGDYLDLADEVEQADMVTLDRVICCYPDMKTLVTRSASQAKRWYGIVYPRTVWWTRLMFKGMNIFLSLRGSPFRTYLHPRQQIEDTIEAQGFTLTASTHTMLWQVAVYAR